MALLLLLPACQFSPTKQEKEKDRIPTPSLHTSISKGLATPAFKIGHWPKLDWWKDLHSEELNHLVCEALKKNPSINEIKKRVEVAREESVIVRSLLFPLVFLNASDDKQYVSHNGLYRALNPTFPISANLVDIAVSFTYDFDFWGKNQNLYCASLGKIKTQQAEKRAVELVIVAYLAQTFFALQANMSKKCLYEQLLKVRKEISLLQSKLKNSALYSNLSPLFAQESVLEAEQLLAKIDEEIEIDKHLINTLVGKGPDCSLEVCPIKPLDEATALPCHLSSDLLARRPDLQAQIWRTETLAHEIGAAIADFYPDINLTGFLGLESTTYQKLFQASSFTWGLKPALHLPLFTAGAIEANVQAKKAEFDAAIFAYNQMLLDSVREIADLLSFGKRVYLQKTEQTRIVSLAKERFELTRLRREKGLDSLFDSYAIIEQLIFKELEDVTLIYDQYLVSIKLMKALGGGFRAS